MNDFERKLYRIIYNYVGKDEQSIRKAVRNLMNWRGIRRSRNGDSNKKRSPEKGFFN
ncbi:hypothetical protein [Bacillus altitudinis]|uniref:hypothetical protein n=1 Tax=Bacillus altitudinis TaxID=293387 RepID=UPI00186462F2|nr:hypothetical protein [Bacillus altitudinis]